MTDSRGETEKESGRNVHHLTWTGIYGIFTGLGKRKKMNQIKGESKIMSNRILSIFICTLLAAQCGFCAGNILFTDSYEIIDIGKVAGLNKIYHNNIETQEKPAVEKIKYNWLNIGIGMAANISTGASISYQVEKHLVSFRAIFQTGILASPPELYEIGVLYGRSRKKSMYLISAAIGFSFVNCHNHNDVLREGVVLGVPVEVQVFITPLSFAGFGVYGFANINTKVPHGGVLLRLQIGDLR